MASLSRTLGSSLVNRSYINTPTSVPALKKLFSVSSASHNPPNHYLVHHHEEHEPSAPAHFGSYAKKRYDGPLFSSTTFNGDLIEVIVSPSFFFFLTSGCSTPYPLFPPSTNYQPRHQHSTATGSS